MDGSATIRKRFESSGLRFNPRQVSSALNDASVQQATSLRLIDGLLPDARLLESDVDILVKFDGPATSKRYFGVQFYLEDLLGCPIDLVTEKALRPELRPYVQKEAVYV